MLGLVTAAISAATATAASATIAAGIRDSSVISAATATAADQKKDDDDPATATTKEIVHEKCPPLNLDYTISYVEEGKSVTVFA